MEMYSDGRLVLIQQNVQPQDVNNYLRWLRLYPQWAVLTRNEKKRLKVKHRNSTVLSFNDFFKCKEEMERNNTWSIPSVTDTGVTHFTIKEEETMNYAYAQVATANPVNPDKQKSDYLVTRLNVIHDEKRRDLSDHFGFNWDKSPANPKELVEKILAGDYWFPKYNDFGEIDEEDLGTSGHPFFDIRWGKKGFKPDRKGYEAAEEKLDAAWQNTKDEIIISTPEKGLEALRAFEAATFH